MFPYRLAIHLNDSSRTYSSFVQVRHSHRSQASFLKKFLLSYRRYFPWHLICWIEKWLLSHRATEPSNVLAWFVSHRSFGTVCQKEKKKCFLFFWKTIWQNLAVLHHFSLPLSFLILPLSSERKRKKWHHMPLDVSNCLKIPYSLQKNKQTLKVGLNCLSNRPSGSFQYLGFFCVLTPLSFTNINQSSHTVLRRQSLFILNEVIEGNWMLSSNTWVWNSSCLVSQKERQVLNKTLMCLPWGTGLCTPSKPHSSSESSLCAKEQLREAPLFFNNWWWSF